MTSGFERRKALTFKQAEGLVELPRQLKQTEIPQSLRSKMWVFIYEEYSRRNEGSIYIAGSWISILKELHSDLFFIPADTFRKAKSRAHLRMKTSIFESDYADFYDTVQFICRCKGSYRELRDGIARILEKERAAFRLVDGDTLFPYSSDGELNAIADAFSSLAIANQRGAAHHLKMAAHGISNGRFADSVRESIHAVESVARTLAPGTKVLGQALKVLEKDSTIHPAMQRGFDAIYGYTNDEQGIRHPLLETGDASVDEADALFMMGACASFVSYLLNKARASGHQV